MVFSDFFFGFVVFCQLNYFNFKNVVNFDNFAKEDRVVVDILFAEVRLLTLRNFMRIEIFRRYD